MTYLWGVVAGTLNNMCGDILFPDSLPVALQLLIWLSKAKFRGFLFIGLSGKCS